MTDKSTAMKIHYYQRAALKSLLTVAILLNIGVVQANSSEPTLDLSAQEPSGSASTQQDFHDQVQLPSPDHCPAAARYVTIKGDLEITDHIIIGALVIWCRPSDEICIIIMQPGVDDRHIVRAPNAPADSPLRSCTVKSYETYTGTRGTGIRLNDVRPSFR